jgi:predicted CxxxxCH...CXXCH cytochrome family protein
VGGLAAMTYNSVTKSCATNYCHGNFVGGRTPPVAPVWTAAGKLGCNACHGQGATATAQPPGPVSATVHHPQNPNCGSCHAGATQTSLSTLAAVSNHVNGSIDRSPNSTGCTGCHGVIALNAVASGSVSVAPGVPGAVDSKGNTDGQTNQPGVGAHRAHVTDGNLRNALACNECHVLPTGTDVSHADGGFDFGWGALARTGPVTPSYAGGVCSNVYCHGTNIAAGGTNHAPTWTTGTSGSCGTCHAVPPPLAAAPNFSPHPQNSNCVACHGTGYTATTVTGAALGVHVNGSTNLSRAGCTLCHGDLSLNNITPGTVSTAPGYSNGTAIVGVDSTGSTNSPDVGAHRAHLQGTRFRAAIACNECHAVPAAGDQTHATGVGTGGSRATLTFGALANADTFTARTTVWNGTTCATSYCHAPRADDTAAGVNLAPAWTGTIACGGCHGIPPATPAHPTGVTECISCHGAGYGTTAITGGALATHLNGSQEGGGDCTGCHGPGGSGTTGPNLRRDVVTEFSRAWSHKRSAGGAVTKWDCIVCHMEGDPATGNPVDAPAGKHKDGVINLRNPDTGANITAVTFTSTSTTPGSYGQLATAVAFTRFSRNLAVTLENDPNVATLQAIQINHCLKCHDANGAQSPLARVSVGGGTTEKPFGTTISYAGIAVNAGGTATAPSGAGVTANGVAGGVINVAESFATTNSSYHPVLGRQNNWYAKSTRMQTPWANAVIRGNTVDTVSWGPLLSCWDCHAAPGAATTITATLTAHGGVTTLRGNPTVPTPATIAALNTNEVSLCKVCHALYDSNAGTNHGTNSAFASGGNGVMQTYLRYGCSICHSSGHGTTATSSTPGAS